MYVARRSRRDLLLVARSVSLKFDGHLKCFLGKYSSGNTLYLGQIRIKYISVSVLLLQNGHAKSACVVLLANRSLCFFNVETPSLILIRKLLELTCFRSFK